MAAYEISTLPDLLQARCQASTAKLSFLDAAGNIVQSLSYAQLFAESQDYAARLISAGLKTDGSDVVITHFADHESHIRIFWACCLAGIPVCPIPLLHLDQSRQVLLFEHLQQLFSSPTLISTDDTISSVHGLVPMLKTLSISRLEAVDIHLDARSHIFPFTTIKHDDIVCFMLTSGSTGNSKAVGLRHSNLLSCIRGKAKHHNTTSSSRLLNWIAFDHVACISDVLLQALVADADQYHISPTAIIQNPRSLLDLCSRYRISFTFSPNFLLAQICRDVVAAPYVHSALDLSCIMAFISGGEAVPVKTAVEFSDILEEFGAPRDSLRAGFGMTETCAGCIFDTRPIPRDVKDFNVKYLSLGKCSDGVSVRVVNPATSAVCAPLEAGQLQVKGPTVFQEYYNNAKANAESFVDGWFITGDTALLDADGNLHMVGRDKDCININGVKHPSIDVEHYIEDQKIDGLMKSFVYVCPMRLADADTETYAVFYQHEIVVENPLTISDIKRIAATNQAIKAACAVFCSQAPYTTIPLPRKSFAKTALGKMSRSALVTAYLRGQYQDIAESLVLEEDAAVDEIDATNAVEEILFDIVATLFSHKSGPLKRSHSLFDMGASSMQLIQLKQRLQERLSTSNIPAIEILKRPGLGDLSTYLADLLNPISTPPASPEYNPLVCLNPAGAKPPLFLVHPGAGEVLVFINLARILADDRPVYALRARGFEPGQTPFTSLVEMLECYTSAIEQIYPGGPYYLGGYSFGGTVAYELGKKLVQRGKRVAWVGILDVPSESLIAADYSWVDSLVDLCDILKLVPGRGPDDLKRSLEQEFPGAAITGSEPPSAREIVQWVLDNGDQAQWKALQLTTAYFRRWVGVAYGRICVGRGYEPSGTVPGALMTMFCPAPAPYMGAMTPEEYKRDHLSTWQKFGDRFETVDIDGGHYGMLSEDHVDSFAEKLRAALGRASKFTNASLLFFKPLTEDACKYFDVLKPDGKTFERNYTNEAKQVLIENLRTRERENIVTLDVEGFQLFSNCPTKFEMFNNAEEIVRAYYPESIDLVKKLTGASKILIWDHNVRRRRVGDNPLAPGQPSRRAHVDFSASQALSILHKLSPASEAPSQSRFQILSFWRPISHPAYDFPLVLCDYRTAKMEEDLVPITTVRPDGEVEVIAVRYNENHKWWYFYGVTPEEVVLIKSYDSTEDSSIAVCSPHTAFEDPQTPKDSPPRESIELRMLVLYE